MTTDPNLQPTRDPHGLAAGIVWSELAAEMRAEAAAAGDPRFEELDRLSLPRPTSDGDRLIDLDRARAERLGRPGDERAA